MGTFRREQHIVDFYTTCEKKRGGEEKAFSIIFAERTNSITPAQTQEIPNHNLHL
jgi:hypothetical protein